jgi:hypothetical protein
MYSQLPSISGGRSSIRNPRTSHAVVTGTDLSWLLTVVTSKSERLWNYWMGNMCIEDWRLLEHDAVPVPEYFRTLEMSIVLSSSVSSPPRRPLYCLTLRMKALWSFKTSGTTFPTTQRYISEGFSLQECCCENLGSRKVNVICYRASKLWWHSTARRRQKRCCQTRILQCSAKTWWGTSVVWYCHSARWSTW